MVKQGSIIMIDFSPVIGSEQGGRRPGVVISSNLAISKTNIVYVCPVTSKQGRSALNVILDDKTKTQGAVLCAHCRSFDVNKRKYTVIEEVSREKLEEIIEKVTAIIEPSE